jgi:peroxiredoxin
MDLIQRVNALQKTGDSLNVIFNAAPDNEKAEMAPKFNQIISDKNGVLNLYVKKMIDEDPGSLVALEAVGRLDKAQDRDYYKKVADALNARHPKNAFVTNFVQSVNVPGQLFVGDMAPEIELPDTEGNMFKLSSLRGQYVLLDFWAAWCRPCRMENPNVVAAYQKYKNKGFTVLGVSLDRDKNAWLTAIQQDNLTWTHISDLQFWQSAAARTYNVSSIPKSFLLDKEGRIIAMDLRGPALDAKLSEILK